MYSKVVHPKEMIKKSVRKIRKAGLAPSWGLNRNDPLKVNTKFTFGTGLIRVHVSFVIKNMQHMCNPTSVNLHTHTSLVTTVQTQFFQSSCHLKLHDSLRRQLTI